VGNLICRKLALLVYRLHIFDKIRSIYSALPAAISSGFTASSFSYNASGACPQCRGEGVLSTHVGYGVIMEAKCPMCAGLRYRPEVLKIKYNNRNIHEVLQLTVDESIEFFSEHSSIVNMLKILQQIGMGYITLGQKSTTISGGEAQRVKLASELGKQRKKGTVYILDEPTSGLSFSDTARLMQLLDDLVTQGNTVIVIEHDPSMLSFCDYIIELGPGGGNAGGEVITYGTVDEVMSNPLSKIGKYLAI
jgi:excinuclease UvrABC ATPase subunit